MHSVYQVVIVYFFEDETLISEEASVLAKYLSRELITEAEEVVSSID